MPVQYRSFYIGKLVNVNEKERVRYESVQENTSTFKSIPKGPMISKT